ncbi:MAG: acyltransferase [Candidatus Krumholzibacteriia bacterium]
MHLVKRDIGKQPLDEAIHDGSKSLLRRYGDFFAGGSGLSRLLRYELYAVVLAPMRGAAGLGLRKAFVPGLLGQCGRGTLWGRDIELRHPGKLDVGDRVAVDDHCLFDARGGEGIRIGDDVVIARDSIFLAKSGSITIGHRCSLGSQVQLSSTAGIHIGDDVGISGQCYIGGGLYHTERTDVPILQQGLYTRGPVIIGDDVWIGAGVRILDGVTVGRGVFVGAGAVIMEDVPEYTMVLPYQRMMHLPRRESQAGPAPATPPDQQPAEPTGPAAYEASTRERVVACILAALDETNRQLPPDQQLPVEPQTVLYSRGNGQGLDSLGLINFVIICEQKLDEELGRTVELAAQGIDAESEVALTSVSAMADYVLSRLGR